MGDIVRRKVTSCAGCGKSHERLEFRPLKKLEVFNGFSWTHSAVCPTNGREVFLRFVEIEGSTHG